MAVPRRIEAISNTSDAMDVEWKGLQEKWKGIMAICVYNIYYIYICIMCIYNYIIYIYVWDLIEIDSTIRNQEHLEIKHQTSGFKHRNTRFDHQTLENWNIVWLVYLQNGMLVNA